MRGPRGWRSALAAVLLLAAVAGTVALGIGYPQTLTSTALAEPEIGAVDERTLVCPLLRRTDDTAEAVTVLPVADAGGDGRGEIRVGQEPAQPLPPGGAVTISPEQPEATVSVRTGGELSATTATVRSRLDPADEGRGLALGQCLPARAEWWFVGVSAAPGHIDELLLSNPTDSPAVVAMEVFGPAGPIPLLGARGVVVQPGQDALVRIDSLIPGVGNATLRVTTTGGLIAAAVRATAIDGLIPQGAEYLPAAAPPATRAVVPGVLPGEGSRQLLLAAQDRDAAVKISLLTADGAATRTSGEQIPVPAGTTVEVDLVALAQGRAAAVAIDASAPVTAAVRSVVKGTIPEGATGVLNRVPVADVAWASAAEPIAAAVVLPLAGVAEAPGAVQIAAVGGAASVSVAARASDGAVFRTTFELPADTVREVAVPVPAGQASAVQVAVQGPGRVYAAAYQVGQAPTGPLAAAAMGADLSTAVTLPLAYPVPRAF